MNNQLNELLRELRFLIDRGNTNSLDSEALNRIAEKIYDYALTDSALGASPVEALVELKTLPKNETLLNIWRERATGALEMYRCMARQQLELANKELDVEVAPNQAKAKSPSSPSHDPISINEDQPATKTVAETNTTKSFVPGDIDL